MAESKLDYKLELTLKLSMEEVNALYRLFDYVGGDPVLSARGYVVKVRTALQEAVGAIKNRNEWKEHQLKVVGSSLYFENDDA